MNQWSDAPIEQAPEAIAFALRAEGVAVDAAALSILDRDDRFAAQLPDGRMAWFPKNPQGLARLQCEARVLELLARHCSFNVPAILFAAGTGWQLRKPVPGIVDPFPIYERVKSDSVLASELGAAMGGILADQHRNVPRDALEGWLPLRPSWPMPREEVARDLPCVIDDTTLIDRCLDLLDRYFDAENDVIERVLTHSDFGFHNLIFDETQRKITGVFDYDDAAFADRHYDFRYLLLDIPGEALLDAAIEAYAAAGGRPIDRHRVALFNAACAASFLAFRAGSAANEKPAGRTLAEDLTWTRLALDRAGD